MICNDCGHTGRMTCIDDSHYATYGNTVALVPSCYYQCPECGGDDVEPSKPCPECGDDIAETGDTYGLCGDCAAKTLDKLRAFRATLTAPEINAIAGMLEDYEVEAWDRAEEATC